MAAGILTAERDDPNIKFTMAYPEGYDHAFSVERLDTVTDPVTGVPSQVWGPIHPGASTFVEGEIDYDVAPVTEEGLPPAPLPSPRTYRALVYRRVEIPGVAVRVLHTEGAYTSEVTI